MSARIVDVLIFIPLILVMPPFWFLPWERWIPSKIAGPYFLYCAFAVWHFKQSWGALLILGSVGIVESSAAIFKLRSARALKQARERKTKILKQAPNWPVAAGLVYYAGQHLGANGVRRGTLSYAFRVDQEEFVSSESFEFASGDDAEQFESRCRGRKVNVHYEKDKPEICVLDRDGLQ